MKALSLVSSVFFFSFAALAEPAMEAAPDLITLANEKVFDGAYENVVCVKSPSLKVRGADLLSVLFVVPNYSPAKIFQGWGENKKFKMIEGDRVTFIKVQFPSQGDQVGWIADYLVRPLSRCEGANEEPSSPVPPVDSLPHPGPSPSPGETDDGAIQGLDDPACCIFPLKDETLADFSAAQRAFGARRDGGSRLHAACDLYRYLNEPILSVAPGTVLRSPVEFYQDTYAIEVRHSGGFVVRYGEITAKRAKGVSAGSKLKAGQVVGYMGKVSSGCCKPMLHLELFSGAKNGSLSSKVSKKNRFGRRSDLLNPTNYLLDWEENSFRSRK